MQAIIDIQNATVFRGMNRVFNRLNVQFNLGENTAIIGPNGAGKTTLLKLITRELFPVVKDNSSVKLFGSETAIIWEIRQKIGVVSHEFQNEYRALATGKDVVLSAFFGSVGIHPHNIVTQEYQDKAQQIMDRQGIANLAQQQYLQLSTGQQRRLLLARALVHDPQVLIFDEPTAGLDLQASFQLIKEMRRLAGSGKTLILVTHHMQELIPEIKRVVMLKNGQIFREGRKEDLMTQHNLTELYGTNIVLSQHNEYYQVSPDV